MSETARGCDGPEASQFDFWVGDWELTWPAEQMGGEPGEVAVGTNRIRRVMSGCVIEESFATADGSFQGRSLSVYRTGEGKWLQTWVDTSGGYLLFSGDFDGEKMELQTEPQQRDEETVVNRMVFRDIAHDSLRWEWQASRDGGESWTDLWNIEYRRMG